METILKILGELHKNGTGFCLQSSGKETYYNLKVYTPQGKEKYISSDNIAVVEEQLVIIWGHLINGTTTIKKTSAELSVPIPPPMPPPPC